MVRVVALTLTLSRREREPTGQIIEVGVVFSLSLWERDGVRGSRLTDLPVAEVFHAAFHFFLLTSVKRTRIRAA